MQRGLLSARQAWSRFRTMNSSSSSSGGATVGRSLAEKVALVTASTDGIGLAIARRLAQDGAHVLVSSRKQANVDRTVAELQAENLSVSGLVCHVGKAEDRRRLVDAAIERYGGIDILVSNAAVNPFVGNILDASEEVWDKSLGPYNVSKTALLGLTRNLAIELAQHNIRVNYLESHRIVPASSLSFAPPMPTISPGRRWWWLVAPYLIFDEEIVVASSSARSMDR
ncbi:hypothetical protein Chor_009678 [Crotalus horridus]